MEQERELPGLGALILVGEPASPLPLEATTVSGAITGAVAQVSVTQRFGNPFTMPLELEYLFPLPHKAAIVDYAIRIGDRTIRAEIKEAEAAKQTYQSAINADKRASLLEQRRPNLFAIQIGNVQPGDTITCELKYEESLTFQDGTFEFVFPMGITPRYHSPSQSAEIARSADTPFAENGEKIAPVEISLTLDAGVEIAEPTSPSHSLQVGHQDARTWSISLEGQHIPNKDFVLRYRASSDVIQPTLWIAQDSDSEVGLLTLLPPRLSANAEIPPREFIFVLDRSGSMSVAPMNQARNALKSCLRALTPHDTFAIQAFDNHIEWFSAEPKPLTQENVDAADAWLDTITSRGGTEILGAIDAALSLPLDPERLRYLVFLTDGSVSADEQAINQIARQRGKARIFTFGIGPSVNRFLLDKLAQIGRGSAEFIGSDEPIELSVARFQDKVSYPSLRDVEISGHNVTFWDTYPSVIPDLYVDQPLQIVTRLKRQDGGVVQVQGEIGGVNQSFQVVLPAASSLDAVKRLWARARIESLLDTYRERGVLDEGIRQQIISIALAYRLVTSFTSFVAVDSEITTGGEATPMHVSVPLPEGLKWEDFSNHAALGFGGGGLPAPAAPLSYASAPRMRASFAPQSAPALDAAKKTSGVGGLLRRIAGAPPNVPAQAASASVPVEPAPPEDPIQVLARTQKINGSWEDDIERTAEALLAFVQSGHTTRTGNYRAQVQKAATWLRDAIPQGSDSAARAGSRALEELANVTGDDWMTDTIRERISRIP